MAMFGCPDNEVQTIEIRVINQVPPPASIRLYNLIVNGVEVDIELEGDDMDQYWCIGAVMSNFANFTISGILNLVNFQNNGQDQMEFQISVKCGFLV